MTQKSHFVSKTAHCAREKRSCISALVFWFTNHRLLEPALISLVCCVYNLLCIYYVSDLMCVCFFLYSSLLLKSLYVFCFFSGSPKWNAMVILHNVYQRCMTILFGDDNEILLFWIPVFSFVALCFMCLQNITLTF